MSEPAGAARHRENRSKRIARHADRVEQQRGVDLDIACDDGSRRLGRRLAFPAAVPDAPATAKQDSRSSVPPVIYRRKTGLRAG
jgi:hypothetical protein